MGPASKVQISLALCKGNIVWQFHDALVTKVAKQTIGTSILDLVLMKKKLMDPVQLPRTWKRNEQLTVGLQMKGTLG